MTEKSPASGVGSPSAKAPAAGITAPATGAKLPGPDKAAPPKPARAQVLNSRPLTNPYQQRLLDGAQLLERRVLPAANGRPAREQKLWRTSFKYPLVREETLLSAGGRAEENARRDFAVGDHIMVRPPEGVSKDQVAAWAAERGYEMRHSLKTTPVFIIATPQASLDAPEALIRDFQAAFPPAAGVAPATAEHDWIVFPTLIPDDSAFTSLWGMHNTGQTGGTVDADIDAPEAWELTTGSRQVVVGVIDTGFDRTHPDLAANAWTNAFEIANNGLDDDNNGLVDDVHGWDFFADDNNPMDEDQHGTHCAGTIGAVGNNRTGVAGVAWQVSIVGIRFLGPSGGTTSDAIDAVRYATRLRVDLTSNSWGGGSSSALLEDAINEAGTANILFITAAGNDGANNDSVPSYPASYPSANLVSVASSTAQDTRSSFSNYGAFTVDLAAPGSGIYSTFPGGGYGTLSGTSMATPHVAGAVALLKSIAPLMDAQTIKTQLMQTADPVAAFTGITVSGGRLNVARLIEASAGARPLVTVNSISEQPGSNGDGIFNPGESLALGFTVTNRGTEPAQNVVATLATASPATSRFILHRPSITIGTLTAGQAVTPATPFLVQSLAGTPTPYTEEFAITVTHGMPAKSTTYRLTLHLHTSSRIEGRVTDAGTGNPLEGVRVVLSGSTSTTATTNSQGNYGVTVTDGSYSVVAQAAGYLTSQPVNLTVPPNRANVNFSLGVPRLQVNPDEVEAALFTGDVVERNVELRNTGTVPLTWSLQLANGFVPLAEGGNETEPATVKLPAAKLPDRHAARDTRTEGGPTTAQEAPALEVPLGSLTNMTIGMVATEWDRSVIRADLQARGADVVTLTLPFTALALDRVDAVIIDDAIALLNNNDLALLRARINAGAGLLCEADNSGSLVRINELLSGTGIVAAFEGFRDLTLTNIAPHPITQGVTSIRAVAAGVSGTLSGIARPLVLEADGKAHAAVSLLGRGVVVFAGNEITSPDNFTTGDGRLFANQAVDALVARPTWLKAEPVSGVIQPGTTTQVRFQFSTQGVTSGTHTATGLLTTNSLDEPQKAIPITLHVNEAPSIHVDATALDFGDVVQGVAATREVVVSNVGALPLAVSKVELSGPDAASFEITGGGFDLAPGATRKLTATFLGNAQVRAHSASLTISSDDPDNPDVILPLKGTRLLAPDIVVTPASTLLNLRQGQAGRALFRITNKGKGVLLWQAAVGRQPDQEGASPAWALITPPQGTLAPGKTATTEVTLNTAILPPGEHTTTLFIASPDPDSPVVQRNITVRVTSAAVAVVTPPLVDFAPMFVGAQSTRQVTVSNPGSANLVISRAVSLHTCFVNTTKLPLTVPPGESRTLSVAFKPLSAAKFSGRLLFFANTQARQFYVEVTGTGLAGPSIQVTPASFAVTSTPGAVVSRTLRIRNTGGQPLQWSAMPPSPSPAWLSLATTPVTLAPGGTYDLPFEVDTSYLGAGNRTLRLAVTSNDAKKPLVTVPISVRVSSAAMLRLSPERLDFGEIWAGQLLNQQVEIANTGNLPLSLLEVVAEGVGIFPEFEQAVMLEPGASFTLPILFNPTQAGPWNSNLKIRTNVKVAGKQEILIPVTATIVKPPAIAVTPGSINENLAPGVQMTRNLAVSNSGGAPLEWTATLRNVTSPVVPAGSLDDVLLSLDASHGNITSLIASRHDFTEGVTGNAIVDGGNNMFDTGNIHSTNLNSGQPIPYSDGVITTDNGTGFSGRYFTRKLPGLFVFAADLDGATRLTLSGGLGADGSGVAAGRVLTRTVSGVTYKGFFKQVYGTSQVPSVNHLIILVSRPSLAHSFSAITDHDQHEVTGLSGVTRVYHLLFSTLSGGQVSDIAVTAIMDKFLDTVVHRRASDWIRFTSPAGVSPPEGETNLSVVLDSSALEPGTYDATVRVDSNALSASRVEVPVRVTVPAAAVLTPEPAVLAFPDTFLQSSTTLTCSLRNAGNMPLTITGISSSSGDIQTGGQGLPLTIPPRQKVLLDVRYSPSQAGPLSGSITFQSNSSSGAQTLLPVTGNGVRGPVISLQPATVAFTLEPGQPATLPLTLANTGATPLQWSATRSNNIASLISLDTYSGVTAAEGATDLVLTAASNVNAAAGTVSGQIQFTSNDPARPTVTLPVSITIEPRPRLLVTPSPATFADTFVLGSTQTTLTLQNVGNAALVINSITASDAQFSTSSVSLPLTLPANGTQSLVVQFSPSGPGVRTGSFTLATNNLLQPTTVVNVSGRGIPPPAMDLSPGVLTFNLVRGQTQTASVNVNNAGGSALSWSASIENASTGSGSLETVLDRFNQNHGGISGRVTSVYNFTEGVTGSFINDGGNDMYDGGNFISTNLSVGSIPYSDNVVKTHAATGTGGRYFTRKQPGVFLFVADLAGASSFSITGDLGTDGGGLVSGLTLTRAFGGITYKGFFKRVFGTSDPSVNHLIILQDRPGLAHNFPADTNLDEHTVSGLSGNSRLYYLLFASSNGAAVSDTTVASIMEEFIQRIALPATPPWLSLSPVSGVASVGGASASQVQVNSASLPVGSHSATLRFTSNAVLNSTQDVPLTVVVTPPDFQVTPAQVNVARLAGTPASTTKLALTAEGDANPQWTAQADVPWITLPVNSGTGSGELTLQFNPALAAGVYTGRVTVTSANTSQSILVTLDVRAAAFSQLITDHARNRLLGVVRGSAGNSSLLAAINPATLAVENTLALPTDITDVDLTTNGARLYAISFTDRTITEVDMAAFAVSATRTLTPPSDLGRAPPYHYHVEAGRDGTVYYTDAATAPLLHVFDFNAGADVAVFQLNSGQGIGDFVVTPDGATIYAWSQSDWGSTTPALITRISSPATNVLVQSASTSSLITQGPLGAPIFLSANRDVLLCKDVRVSSDFSSTASHPGQNAWAASAYGHVIVTDSKVIDPATAAVLATLPVTTTVSAFTPDQSKLVYYHPGTQTLGSMATSGFATLPPVAVAPGIANGSVVAAAPGALSWSGVPTAAFYEVYLGTDAAAVAAATPATAGIYRATTPGVSFTLNSNQFVLGQTYYWRIDSRWFDNTRTTGTVWSFRMPSAAVAPAALAAEALPGSTAPIQLPLTITTGSGTTAWSVTDNASWVSTSANSGQGTTPITVTLNPAGLSPGSNQAQITVTSGSDSVVVPVTLKVLGALNITRLVADPALPWVYGLHTSTTAPFEDWLLWINPATATVEKALITGTNVTDIAVHSTDDRIYALTDSGTQVKIISRQGTPQVLGNWPLSTAARTLLAGPAGRVLTLTATHSLQLRVAGTGAAVGQPLLLSPCQASTSPTGAHLYAEVQQSPTQTVLARYSLGATGLSFLAATPAVNGTVTAAPVVAGNGSRVFFRGRAVNTSSMSVVTDLGLPVHAASPSGLVAYTAADARQVSTGLPVFSLPASSPIQAATADGGSLVMFDSASRSLARVGTAALGNSPASLAFGNALVNSTAVRTLTVTNLSTADLNVSLASSSAPFSVPSTAVSVNAGQSASFGVVFQPTQATASNGTLTFSVVGSPGLTRTLAVSGTGVTQITEGVVDFSLGAPGDGLQLVSSTPYAEDGMVLTTSPASSMRVGPYYATFPSNGSAHLAVLAGQTAQLRRANNGLFTLRSISLAEYSTAVPTARALTFTGVKADNSTVTVTFTLDGVIDGTGPLDDFQTFAFPATFTGLKSVSLDTDLCAVDDIAFENVVGASSLAVAEETPASRAAAPAVAASLGDADGDGVADFWCAETPPTSAAVESITYTRSNHVAGLEPIVEASRDGLTWISLTPGVDYEVTETQPLNDGVRGQVTLRLLPAAEGWRFRLSPASR